MIVKYNGRPFRRIEATGYSTDEVEEMVGHPAVEVVTEAEYSGESLRGSAPKPIRDKLEGLED